MQFRTNQAAWQAIRHCEHLATIYAALEQLDEPRLIAATHAPSSSRSLYLGALRCSRRFPGVRVVSVLQVGETEFFAVPVIAKRWLGHSRWRETGPSVQPMRAKDRRARKLLRSWLPVNYRSEFDRHGWVFAVPKPSERMYVIHERGWVEWFTYKEDERDLRPLCAFCLHPPREDDYSPYDTMLAQRMLIEDDEEDFLRRANMDGIFDDDWYASKEGKLLTGLRSMRAIEASERGVPIEARGLLERAGVAEPLH